MEVQAIVPHSAKKASPAAHPLNLRMNSAHFDLGIRSARTCRVSVNCDLSKGIAVVAAAAIAAGSRGRAVVRPAASPAGYFRFTKTPADACGVLQVPQWRVSRSPWRCNGQAEPASSMRLPRRPALDRCQASRLAALRKEGDCSQHVCASTSLRSLYCVRLSDERAVREVASVSVRKDGLVFGYGTIVLGHPSWQLPPGTRTWTCAQHSMHTAC
eukprot:352421-Chlamydomonas_euryale.AAC.50